MVARGQRLDDAELRARAEQSARDSERTIEEWRTFVDGLRLARQAMRAARRVGASTEMVAGLRAS